RALAVRRAGRAAQPRDARFATVHGRGPGGAAVRVRHGCVRIYALPRMAAQPPRQLSRRRNRTTDNGCVRPRAAHADLGAIPGRCRAAGRGRTGNTTGRRRAAHPTMKAGAIGARFEQLALEHMERAGLKLVERNYRTRFGELDLVMRNGATLVFAEVRYRRDVRFGGGAASVGAAKREKLTRAAQGFLQAHPRLASLP